jgi:hypothetical protein
MPKENIAAGNTLEFKTALLLTPWKVLRTRVARFFVVKYTKTWKNMAN